MSAGNRSTCVMLSNGSSRSPPLFSLLIPIFRGRNQRFIMKCTLLWTIAGYRPQCEVSSKVSYPTIYVLSSSFSSGIANSTGHMVLWPVDFSLKGYKTVFAHSYISSAYRNTIFYTVAGTLINLFITLTCAYLLSRRDFPMQRFFIGSFLFTMFSPAA